MWLTVAAIFIAITLLIYSSVKRPANFPPGPTRYPVIGNLLQVNPAFPNQTLERWWKTYGNIFSIKFGTNDMVIVCEPEAIKKAFAGNDFLDRPKTFIFAASVYGKNAGISTSWGPRWIDHRRFTIRHLKDYGLGKSKTEDIITTEMLEVIKKLKEKDGQEVELSWDFNCAVTNVIWSITAGYRMETDSKEIQEFHKLIQDIFKLFGSMSIVDSLPWIRHFVPKKWILLDQFEAAMETFYKFFQDEVDKHRLTFNSAEEDRDLIDSYLRRFEEESKNPGYDKELEEFNLIAILGDLFSAGGETTYTTIRWSFLYLLKYPDIKKKIQNLVDEATGGNIMPSLTDKASASYIEAFIMEVQRHASVVPQGVPHAATCDTSIMGYSIPKGTQVIPYLTACFKNAQYWGDPEVFRPERFLDQDGNIVKIDAFMPFSVGRRMCPGEHLAKAQLFLIISSLLQQFDFEPLTGNPDDVSLETENESVVRYPKPYKMKIKTRKL